MVSEERNQLDFSRRRVFSLNAISNVLVVVMCFAALAVFLSQRPARSRQAISRGGIAALARGTTLQFPHNERTVLISLSANCGLCEREAEQYRELERNFAFRPDVGFVYFMPDIAETGRRFLSIHGLTGAAYFSQNPATLGMEIPGATVVDRGGAICFSSHGALDAGGRQRLELALSSR